MGSVYVGTRNFLLLVGALFAIPASAQVYSIVRTFGGDRTGSYPTSPVIAGPDGTLYGTTQAEFGIATIFRTQPNGSDFTVIKSFTNAPLQGSNLAGGLVLVGDVLYGTAAYGGSANRGVIYRVNKSGADFAVVKHFTGTDGAYPFSQLLRDGDTFYGTTEGGGNSGRGTLFKIKIDGTGFTVLRHLSGAEARPHAGLVLSGNKLYGTSIGQSSLESGGVFSVNTDGTGFAMLKVFSPRYYSESANNYTNAEGAYPYGTLALADGVLYGTTEHAGPTGNGTVFRINTDGTGFSLLRTFTAPDGGSCHAGVTMVNGVLYGAAQYFGGTTYAGSVYRLNTNGTGFAVLKVFDYYNTGANPQASLLFSGGVLFGTAENAGPGDRGVVFRINPDGGDFRVIKAFGQNEGINPYTGLTQVGNNLYGTTFMGGTAGNGTLYRLNPDNSEFQVMKNFDASTGRPRSELAVAGSTVFGATDPGVIFRLTTGNSSFTALTNLTGSTNSSVAPMISLSGNALYGITYMGGPSGNGTIFRINTNGTGYTLLRNCTAADGSLPHASPTVSGSVMYGTTTGGGSAGSGVLYRMNTDGSGYVVLRSLAANDGRFPFAKLVLDGETLYGTTVLGGANGNGTVFSIRTNGSGFTVLKNFSKAAFYPTGLVDTNSDGMSAGALQLHRGVLFGVAETGGSKGLGTLFAVSTNGTGFQVLKTFSGSDGANPWGTLTAVGSALYGTAHNGGVGGGVVFKLEMGPAIVSHPVGTTNPCGSPVTLSIAATGPQPLAYQWYRNGDVIALATGSAHSFIASPATAGDYFVTITNSFGVTTSILANVQFTDSAPPEILARPTNMTSNAFADCSLRLPDMREQIIAADCGGGVSIIQTPPGNSSLSVGVTPVNFAVSDSSGNTTNVGIEITVLDVTAPVIAQCVTPQTLGIGPDCLARLPDLTSGIIAQDTCGGPIEIEQLPVPGTPLPLGETNVLFTVKDASGNSSSCTALISVKDLSPPVILNPPLGRTNALGTDAEFKVTATSCSPMRYQWQFNGMAIPGATAPVLIVHNVEASDLGNYAIVVSNSFVAITSAPAALTLNFPPVADASATRTFVISPNGTSGTVVLDGSRSNDAEGDPLRYRWVTADTSEQLATGVVAIVTLPVGTNAVRLEADDGYSTSTDTIQIRVVTVIQALDELIECVQANVSPSQPLVATLRSARSFVQKEDLAGAIHQLQVFQMKVRAQVQRENPALAGVFDQSAQAIINTLKVALRSPANQDADVSPVSVTREKNGKAHIKFSATPGKICVIAASSDLTHWQLIGVAKECGGGDLEFSDPDAGRFSARFYRIISP